MSLYKQLWLSIAFLMILAFGGSFVVSCLSAKAYLEEQLYQKNLDNATSLALSLSSEVRDTMMIELFIHAQYDSGHYQFIRLADPEGKIIVELMDTNKTEEAPRWLISLFPISVEPGIAQISNGWQQVGTLTLSSQTHFAYRQLWNNAKRLFYYFLLVSLSSGVIGSLLLGLITQPLKKAVDHAKAIGERRFITTKEPRTLEFRAVIRSMNKLSQHVKDMLKEESSKLEKLRTDIQHDNVTGLLNREPTLNTLHAYLNNEDASAHGTLVLLRISDLFDLNQSHGRQTMDGLLTRFGEALIQECESRDAGSAGRLNGSDFLVLLPGEDEGEAAGTNIKTQLQRLCRDMGLEKIQLRASSTHYHSGENISALLRRIDTVLTNDQVQETSACIHVATDAPSTSNIETKEWTEILSKAMGQKRFTLKQFPVRDTNNQLLHWEAPVRLIQTDNSLLSAGQFMPQVTRLGMATMLDLIVADLAIEQIKQQNSPIGINLSASLLSEPEMMKKLAEKIKGDRKIASLLWLEVPEYGAFQNMEGFRTLCQLLKPLNCKIGIEHIGQEVTHIGELHDLGLDYVKIDRALIHNIDSSTAYQVFLRGLCTIVHSIGLKAIAEGIETKKEWLTLNELGIDGGTGGFFS